MYKITLLNIFFFESILLINSIIELRIKNQDVQINMKNYKIIISGLDNAGKTSLLKAFDRRYDFHKEVLDLEPTKKIEYHNANFLDNSINYNPNT